MNQRRHNAAMEMSGVKDVSLLLGKYNLWKDPVCNEIMGKEVIDRVFRGEAVTFPNFPAPIQDVLDRGVIEQVYENKKDHIPLVGDCVCD